MILLLDTTSEISSVKLFDDSDKIVDSVEITGYQVLSEELLKTIDNILKMNGLKKEDLSSIIINPGPGSYTGVRIGVATANMLAYSLNIPIYSGTETDILEKKLPLLKIDAVKHKFTSPVLPYYSNPPHITKPKAGR